MQVSVVSCGSILPAVGQHAGCFLPLEHFLISHDRNTYICQQSEYLLFWFLLGKTEGRWEGKREL